MSVFDKLLGHKLFEDLLGSPNLESEWWTDVIFRGLQAGGFDELGAKSECAGSTEIENRELL